MMAESMRSIDLARGTPLSKVSKQELRVFSRGTYECKALLIPEEGGGFSAFALRLPGVVSQGETEVDALNNIADAFRGAIQTYIQLDRKIPWGDANVDRRKGSKERWIIVDV